MNKKLILIILVCTAALHADQSIEKYYNLAQAQSSQKKYAQAIRTYRHILSLDTQQPQAYFQLGLICFALHKYDAAAQYFDITTQFLPEFAGGWSNLGLTWREYGNWHKALAAYTQAIKLEPNSHKHNLGAAYCYLAMEDFRQAHEHLHRIDTTQWTAEALHGKTVLVTDGGGYGDTINWLRFTKTLKDRGACVIVELDKPHAQNIIATCPYIDHLILKGEVRPPHDQECALVHLKYALDITVDTIPTPIPYVHANEKLVREWGNALSFDDNLKVGIFWEPQRYRNSTTGELVENRRAIPLAHFYSLARIPGVSLYSLQKLFGTEQLDEIPSNITIHTFDDFDEERGAFVDTAAIIANLDLVVTIDSSVAHLAGALGARVWTLVPYASDWRWFIDRTDSPWYPTMRLFRCKEHGGWDSVIEQVEKELRKLCK